MSFTCPYCNKPCVQNYGLRNHLNNCKMAPVGADLDGAYNEAVHTTPTVKIITKPNTQNTQNRNMFNRNENMSRYDEEIDERDDRDDRRPPKIPNFDVGAFLVLDKVPILLDINFAVALGDMILEAGSENKAIIAFAHKLSNLVGD